MKCIDLNLKARDKNQCIDNLVELMYGTGNIKDKKTYRKSILERESLSTTGIGDGIAIPHGKSSSVKKATLVAAVCRDGIDYYSLYGQPSKLFFMISVGGGILIALAFLFDYYSIDPSNFGMNTTFAAFLRTVGGQAFG